MIFKGYTDTLICILATIEETEMRLEEMSNVVDYAKTQLKTFEEAEFCEIDSLIFSCMAYLRLPEDLLKNGPIPFKEFFRSECFEAMFQNVYDVDQSKALFTALCCSPRFRNVKVSHYQSHWDASEEQQFAAVTFEIFEDLHYAAFRGTDSTIVGWKEDFNMAFEYPIPSQKMAANYLEEIAAAYPGKLMTGGHSKGGNLAVYAGMNAKEETKKRLVHLYSHEGPGFPAEVFSSAPYKSVETRILKTVPQSSIIGMILEEQENYDIIKSDGFSLWQHDPYTWLVEEDHFITIQKLTNGALLMDTTIHNWLVGIDAEKRKRFITALYTILDQDDAKTSKEFRETFFKNLPRMIEATTKLDPDTKKFMADTLKEMANISLNTIPEILKEKTEQFIQFKNHIPALDLNEETK